MDSALTDMAYHNSEAYAVGTRNGVAVSSGDVTYHNNSKYYCDLVSTNTDRAEAAAARAEAAVPASTAGAVFFSTAQSLTTAQQYQAKANIGAGSTNPSLLDNPWFTVNQRSAGSTSDGYPADRWLKVGNTAATATATANGLVIALNGSNYCDLRNRYSEAEIITPNLGKTATISAMLADGTVFSDQIVLNTTQQNRYLNSEKIRFDLSVSGGVYLMRLVLYDDMTIRAVKLELGSVSTLANDAPPNYAEELAKCKYYCRVVDFDTDVSVGIGWAFSNSGAVIPNIFGFGNEMRAVPTVTSTGNFVLRTTGGSNINATSFAIGASVKDAISLNVSVASGLTANQPVRLQAGTGAKLVFSADL